MEWQRRTGFATRRRPPILKKKTTNAFCCCGKSNIKQPESVSEILKNFEDNTTLIGISHIIKKKSLFWLIAYIFCLSLSIFQSWQSAEFFFAQRSHLSVSVKNSLKLKWPSITVCNNVVMNKTTLSKLKLEGYRNLTNLNCTEKANDTLVEQIKDQNAAMVMEYVRTNLSEKERKEESLARDLWLAKCSFSYKPCDLDNKSLFHQFNNPVDGNCFTFNPGFNKTQRLEMDIDSKLTMDFHRFGTGYQLRGNKAYVSFLVHSPGTTPLMDLPEAIDVYDRQYVNLGLRLVQKDFMLKARTKVPTCVMTNELGESFRRKNFYFNQTETPYEYSVEACMKHCVQVEVNSPCGSLDATFPILNSTLELLNASLPPIQCPGTADKDISMENCGCPFPCEYLQYQLTVDTTDMEKDTANDSCPSDEVGDNHRQRMKVSIQFLSNIYDYTEEVLDYDLTQFLGFLGGNISLWLGLCVLSLLEVLELGWDIIAFKCRQRYEAKKNSKDKLIRSFDKMNLDRRASAKFGRNLLRNQFSRRHLMAIPFLRHNKVY